MKLFSYWHHSDHHQLIFKRKDEGYDTIIIRKILARRTGSYHAIVYHDGHYRDLNEMEEIGFTPIGSSEHIGQVKCSRRTN